MLKNKYIKLAAGTFVILIALWAVTPKVYVTTVLNPFSTDVSVEAEAKVKSESSPDAADIEKYNKPSYFNLFKFVSSFIPSKAKP